jgi:aquaporin Z
MKSLGLGCPGLLRFEGTGLHLQRLKDSREHSKGVGGLGGWEESMRGLQVARLIRDDNLLLRGFQFRSKVVGQAQRQVSDLDRGIYQRGRIRLKIDHLLPEIQQMKNYATEFIGTFFLVFTIGLSVLSGSPMAPLAIGTSLMVMVYMGGHISGAHYNPAVTLAVYLRGKLESKEILPYWIAQVVGALAASAAVKVILNDTFAPAPGETATVTGALLVEVLYTFALALVVLNVATAEKTSGNSFYGLAIGFTVMAAAFAGGGVSGGAFNPAVGIGPTVIHATMGDGGFGHLWLYLAGPFAGGALAAMVFKIQDAG